VGGVRGIGKEEVLGISSLLVDVNWQRDKEDTGEMGSGALTHREEIEGWIFQKPLSMGSGAKHQGGRVVIIRDGANRNFNGVGRLIDSGFWRGHTRQVYMVG
jgi:hypothetical protein